MTDPIRPAWLAGLRIVAPADLVLSDVHGFPPGSWIVRHGIQSRDLDALTTAGHRMIALDGSHTLIAPALYIGR